MKHISKDLNSYEIYYIFSYIFYFLKILSNSKYLKSSKYGLFDYFRILDHVSGSTESRTPASVSSWTSQFWSLIVLL